MNANYIYAFFGILILLVACLQLYNTISFESSVGSYENYVENIWLKMPEDMRPANPYSAYSSEWREHANVNPIIPAFIIASFFGYMGYLFYDDWANNGYKNKRKFLGVVSNEV